MGEAKLKQRKHADILANANGCLYCAGRRKAIQIDHMPPRAMFRMSQRPRGLEFPCCAECNQGTSRLDVVATFMTRTFPGIQNDADSAEWDKVMNEVGRVAPGLPREIMVPPNEMRAMLASQGIFDENLAAFKADGPILGSHMQAFAAKVGFALRYEDVGYPVPDAGAVQVRWFTSSENFSGVLPESLLKSVGETKFLKQGKIDTEGHFEYGWGDFALKPNVRLYYAKFREAFTIAAFVADDLKDVPFPVGQLATFAPGDLTEDLYDRIVDW